MKNIELLEKVAFKINEKNNPSLKLSLKNVHAEGLFSLVVDGTEFGKLTRIFIADKKINPYDVQLHTHRYPIKLTVISGKVKHYVAKEVNTVNSSTINLSQYEYSSVVTGGSGLKYLKDVNLKVKDYYLPIGSSVVMDVLEYHTVSCNKDAMWIVEEGSFEVETSKLLGVPFSVENMYIKPTLFEIIKKSEAALKEINHLIQAYKSV